MRINRYVSLKYGTGEKYKGKEVAIGGRRYVQYDNLADLKNDFPSVG